MLDREQDSLDDMLRKALRVVLQGEQAARFVESVKDDVINERAEIATLQQLMNLVLLNVYNDEVAGIQEGRKRSAPYDPSPVYRAG
jgi:hypothetical protein